MADDTYMKDRPGNGFLPDGDDVSDQESLDDKYKNSAGQDDSGPEVAVDEEKLEQKIKNEEYKVWKKNSIFLYDRIYSRALEWPTLTTQWFPDVKSNPDSSTLQHRILYGTHTSGQANNYIQIATLDVPKSDRPDPNDINETTGEIGGHGAAKADFSFNVIQKINHPGEVNKARYQPQNPNIIATMCPDSRVLIFDRTKHLTQPKDSTIQVELELVGHAAEGFGLSWSPFHEGRLATGCEDSTVKLWDIREGFSKETTTMEAASTWTHHNATVNDVQYHPIHSDWIGTVSDDSTLQIIDTRTNEKSNAVMKDPSPSNPEMRCLAFHPLWNSVVITGSSDSTILQWDLRLLSRPVHQYKSHTEEVVKLEWHPTKAAVFGSASNDRRICLWDASRVGMEMTDEELQDGPPELIFLHGGFTNSVCDFNWNKNDPWMMLASSEDNQLQAFKPAKSITDEHPPQVQNQDIQD